MTEKIDREKNLVERHSIVELLEHWLVAISGLVLLVTGLFEMPMAKRYYISSVPGLGWSADYIVALNVHYVAAFVFIAACVFHVVYHLARGDKGLMPQRGDLKASFQVIKSFFGVGEEPPFHKYLPEQRLAYVGMAFIIFMLIVSGLIKTYKNLYAPDMSYGLVLTATWIHNIFFVLFFLAFVAHIAALIIKPNRPLVRGIFTGKLRLDYARSRHYLWVEELERGSKGE
ncbi:MAG TPA: cytochrome b/b6 domain-containing protein [Syntrophales bacterium]|nr:cytochrome b/b6 domain-containing protein [Syntrophales bacterium]HOL59489.1 cytochrome b/b6 domain-containing protein [Syntrophales bacterium]HPO34671.1 cytochrome b/b6 domain-containing protein [Syntrophales bacterium]